MTASISSLWAAGKSMVVRSAPSDSYAVGRAGEDDGDLCVGCHVARLAQECFVCVVVRGVAGGVGNAAVLTGERNQFVVGVIDPGGIAVR